MEISACLDEKEAEMLNLHKGSKSVTGFFMELIWSRFSSEKSYSPNKFMCVQEVVLLFRPPIGLY